MSAEIPRSQKIILRSSPVDRRHALSVDEKHVIALAPPPILILQHRHGHAHKVPSPACFHPDVVPLTVEIFLIIDDPIAIRCPLIGPPPRRRYLPILSVKVKQI